MAAKPKDAAAASSTGKPRYSRRLSRDEAVAEDAQRLRAIWDAYKAKTGRTQREVAESLGMSPTNFAHYLNGKVLMDMDIMLQFCTLFAVTVDDLSPSAAHSIRQLAGISDKTPSPQKSRRKVLSEMAGKAIEDSGLDEKGVTALISFLKVASPPKLKC